MDIIITGFYQKWNRIQEKALSLIKKIPEDRLNFKPKETLFSIKELVCHIYNTEKIFIDTVKEKGEIVWEDFEAINNIPEEVKDVDSLCEYAKKVHENTNTYCFALGTEEVMKPVKTPFGTHPLFVTLGNLYEHLIHHRGQLYTYIRLCGVEEELPHML